MSIYDYIFDTIILPTGTYVCTLPYYYYCYQSNIEYTISLKTEKLLHGL